MRFHVASMSRATWFWRVRVGSIPCDCLNDGRRGVGGEEGARRKNSPGLLFRAVVRGDLFGHPGHAGHCPISSSEVIRVWTLDTLDMDILPLRGCPACPMSSPDPKSRKYAPHV